MYSEYYILLVLLKSILLKPATDILASNTAPTPKQCVFEYCFYYHNMNNCDGDI